MPGALIPLVFGLWSGSCSQRPAANLSQTRCGRRFGRGAVETYGRLVDAKSEIGSAIIWAALNDPDAVAFVTLGHTTILLGQLAIVDGAAP
jgi:hypothetical protein